MASRGKCFTTGVGQDSVGQCDFIQAENLQSHALKAGCQTGIIELPGQDRLLHLSLHVIHWPTTLANHRLDDSYVILGHQSLPACSPASSPVAWFSDPPVLWLPDTAGSRVTGLASAVRGSNHFGRPPHATYTAKSEIVVSVNSRQKHTGLSTLFYDSTRWVGPFLALGAAWSLADGWVGFSQCFGLDHFFTCLG